MSMPLRAFCGSLLLIAALSGCTSISSTTSLERRPDGQVTALHVSYIQNSFVAKNRLSPGVLFSPAAMLERDGYYDLGNELRVVVPEVAHERGVQADVSVSYAGTARNYANGSSGMNPAAIPSTDKELVLFVKSGTLMRSMGDANTVFHAILRDSPSGTEYWHADYRVKVNNVEPGDPAFDEATVKKLISSIFDDLAKDGLVGGARGRTATGSQPDVAVTQPQVQPQPLVPEQRPTAFPQQVPYIDARGQAGFQKWLTGGMHRAFAISADGHWGYSADAPAVSGSTQAAEQRALSVCQILAKSECFIYALDNSVVWHGAAAGASSSSTADH
jgi:hypothetical protein